MLSTTLRARALGASRATSSRSISTTLARFNPSTSKPLLSSTTATQPHPKPPSAAYHPAKSSIFTPLDTFTPRHIGPRQKDVDEMLAVLGHKSMDEFIDATIPTDLRVAVLTDKEGEGIRPFSELELRRRAEEVASMNKSVKSYIGMGWVWGVGHD